MKKNMGSLLLFFTLLLAVAAVLIDQFYVGSLKKQFMALEKQRIETSNKLATAKIVDENLNHVRDLVFQNIDFPMQTDTVNHETHIFNFVTTCINDLKLKLVSVKPLRPQVNGLVTTYGYDIEIDGDFFKFGELCSKFENSRRIISLETYDVALIEQEEKKQGGPENKMIKVKMRINTFRIKKS
jgi:Tfp pilus assembly protein PilO